MTAVQRGRAWWWLAAVGSVAVALWTYFAWDYVEDDGFIHLEYARNVAEGRGFTFDGRAVFADSSPLWVALLVAFHWLVGDWEVAAKVLSVTAYALTFVATARLAARVFSDAPSAAVATALVAMSPFTLYWSTAGMEAVMAMGLSLWALDASTRQTTTTPTRQMAFFAVLGVLPLLRFELALLGGLLGIRAAWQRWPLGKRDLWVLGACAVLVAAPLLGWMAYAHEALGSAVPTTNAAKRLSQSWNVVSLFRAVRQLILVVGFGFPAVLAAAPIVVWLRKRQGAAVTRQMPAPATRHLLLLWPLVLSAFYALNLTAVQTRYALLVGSPLLLWALATLHAAWGARSRAYMATQLATAAVAAATIAFSVVPHTQGKVAGRHEMDQLAKRVRERIPPQVGIAAFSIGQLAFLLPHRIIDVGALTMPEALQHMGEPERMLEWAIDSGASCLMSGWQPQISMPVVLQGTLPARGWIPHGPPRPYFVRCLPGTPLLP